MHSPGRKITAEYKPFVIVKIARILDYDKHNYQRIDLIILI
jgi:hypothetical protein